MPPIKAQFFYYSPLPIDDPLSAAPPSTGSEIKSAKHDPRPFSEYDNNALEEVWLSLSVGKDSKNSKKSYKAPPERQTSIVNTLGSSHNKKANHDKKGKDLADKAKNASSKDDAKPSKKRPSSGKAANLGPAPENSAAAKPIDPITTKTHAGDAPGKPKVATDEGLNIVSDKCFPKDNKVSAKKAGKQTAPKEDKKATEPIHKDDDGNPFNTDCEDPVHAILAVPDPCCCSVDNPRMASHTTNTESYDGQGVESSNKPARDASPEVNIITASTPATPNATETPSKEQIGRSKNHPFFMRHIRLEHKNIVPTLNKSDQAKVPESDVSSSSSTPTSTVVVPTKAGTSGTPFVKFTPGKDGPQSPVTKHPTDSCEPSKPSKGYTEHYSELPIKTHERDPTETETICKTGCKHKRTKDIKDITVGISRLHLVKLPALRMEPVYWSPVHDIAIVTRGTWFYKDSMYPVEPAVANQLEAGFKELRPWSQTWIDELNSAVDVGAAGEEKIAHRLWPKEADQKKISPLKPKHPLSTDPYCAARCFNGEAAAEGSLDPDDNDAKKLQTLTISKKYPNSQVIYTDSLNAYILKPTLQPSSYYGRKPLQKIRKGTTVGIPVVRKFDWKAWEKLHKTKKTTATYKAEANAPASGDANSGKLDICAACRSREERPKVTDLVFVVHGIGQKLSERVESFHFTHLTNAFRRSVNVELGDEAVKRVLRENLGGVMVLPINWRSNLSFEDGGPIKEGDKDQANPEFSLKDITPETIPAVRNLISDVMLDIPFYMSHHKPKMIQAVISEANRIYRLWCRNNPAFHESGRVHIIAHSLGSVMALEVLSKQPTSVKKLDFNSKKLNTKHFDFNTCNLFFAGSPAGFFLLLDKGKLLPRKGLDKAGAEFGDDTHKDVAGEEGTLGCLAVHNLYNIIHYNDPIAYRLNATIDPTYAKSLKSAQVPSATTGFFENIGQVMRAITPGVSTPTDLGVGQVAKPPNMTRMPSNLEMDVHDFTREELAEKKTFLLNDNGQVDWFLSSGGGPLEIQYINMLGAHSSYWFSPDFIRLVVTEIGRKPGRDHALPNMRAVKVGHKG